MLVVTHTDDLSDAERPTLFDTFFMRPAMSCFCNMETTTRPARGPQRTCAFDDALWLDLSENPLQRVKDPGKSPGTHDCRRHMLACLEGLGTPGIGSDCIGVRQWYPSAIVVVCSTRIGPCASRLSAFKGPKLCMLNS